MSGGSRRTSRGLDPRRGPPQHDQQGPAKAVASRSGLRAWVSTTHASDHPRVARSSVPAVRGRNRGYHGRAVAMKLLVKPDKLAWQLGYRVDWGAKVTGTQEAVKSHA